MTSGADLFVVCKQCGSEVSPYITECPYCGGRLRRRAPKLPRAQSGGRSSRGRKGLGRLLGRAKPSVRLAGEGRSRPGGDRWSVSRPYATIALVSVGALGWIVPHAEPEAFLRMSIIGPLHGDWWRLFTSEFAYLHGFYAFLALVAIALFGWLLERRHGPLAVLAVFFGAGVTGALVASAVYPLAVVNGGNAAALGLLGAWAAEDLLAARVGSYYEGDLLGTAAIAVLLAAIPFAYRGSEMSWLAGVSGLAVGLIAGAGMTRVASAER